MGRPADLSSWSALLLDKLQPPRAWHRTRRALRAQPAITRPTSTAENVSPVPEIDRDQVEGNREVLPATHGRNR